jgi:flagellar biosynthesis protein FlhG
LLFVRARQQGKLNTSPYSLGELIETHHGFDLKKMNKKKDLIRNGARVSNSRSPESPSPRVIAVTSGKGGVGKTSIVGNLALAFRRLGRRVLVLDGDLSLPNMDIIFGLNTPHSIKDVIKGEKDLSEVIVEGPEQVLVIPADSEMLELDHLTDGQKLNLLSEFDRLNGDFHFFLIDTAAGISSDIMYFSIAAQERIVVVTSEPSSIANAYALMKVMFQQHGTDRFKLLVNMVTDAEEARWVFEDLSDAISGSLGNVSLEYIGYIPEDEDFHRAVRQATTVLQRYPESESSRSFYELAKHLLASSANTPADGNIKFFWRKLMSLQ